MELKVWVDGVVRVVCGLTPSTSCKDVVIALAQSLGNSQFFLNSWRLSEEGERLSSVLSERAG